jgi:hypothetical protein
MCGEKDLDEFSGWLCSSNPICGRIRPACILTSRLYGRGVPLVRFVIIGILIIVGYYLMRSFMKNFLGNSGAQRKDEAYSHAKGRKQERHGRDYKNLEIKYQKILGVTNADSPITIKEKYRDLIAKYHPDKLQHLGEEFQVMAEQKTREIIEAYDFFRKRYNM